MKRAYFISTHCQFCEIAAVNTRGDVVERDRCVTCIPALLEVIERVPPRLQQLPARQHVVTPRRPGCWFGGVSCRSARALRLRLVVRPLESPYEPLATTRRFHSLLMLDGALWRSLCLPRC